jgi:hypothetical protein
MFHRKCRTCRGKGFVEVFDSPESERNSFLNVTMLATLHFAPYPVGFVRVHCPACLNLRPPSGAFRV